jgi:conjugative transfer relaxase protein TraI
MLSIHPLESAEGAASYYLNVVNYYEKDSKSIRWLGSGAKELGLHGKTVEKEQMLSLLKGTLPDGTQLGRIDMDGIHHRPGFDMTVSAPKSFSILLETEADPMLAQILDETVDWFVEEMEKDFAQTRQVVNGKVEYVDTQNFLISAFRQPNSRANDPQSHVHLVTHNMTKCQDEKWRSLASDMDGRKGVVEQIMKHHVFGGLKFRNYLANKTKELGYEIESDGDGLWEIKGLPEALLSHFSKRSEEIKKDMDEQGWSGAKAASISAGRTREDKELIDLDKWRENLVLECVEHGFDPDQFVSSVKPQNFLVRAFKEQVLERFYNVEDRARDAVHVAIESVSQQQAVFDERAIKKEALKYSIASTQIIDEKHIDQAIKQQVKEQNLYQATHPYTKEQLYTTPWQLTLEAETVERIEQGKNDITPICSKKKTMEFIKAKEDELQFSLSPSQKRAMVSFVSTKDRYMAIQGYAGTGKTTMLRLTRELASSYGYTIRGITAGSSAANELSVKGGLDAATFARELGRLQKHNQDLSKTIFVVDEASMFSNPQGHKIIQLVEKFNTQLKIIGDKAQLPSPSSGRWFSLTQDYGIDTVNMTDNLRQKDSRLKESAQHASQGEIYDAVEKLTQVHTEETYLERVQSMADKWLSLSPNEREQTLCFAPTHRNRHDITEILREALKQEGVLSGAEHQLSILKEKPFTSIKLRKAFYYASNDIIRFNITIARHQIKAGDYFRVGSISAKHKGKNTLPLIGADGKERVFPLASLPEFKTQNKDLERPMEVYNQSPLSLMAGDKIQWKRNSEAQGIRNSELGIVTSINEQQIEIMDDNKKIITLLRDASELKHLDHGYVLTTYASQGKDSKRGLGLIESFNRFATTIQNFYVEITRAIESMTVVTDDKDILVKAITLNDSEKNSALEMTSSQILKSHDARFKDAKNRVSLVEVIQKKLSKEEEWNKNEKFVEHYVSSKQENNRPYAAKIANTIVQSPPLYRLSKERLGFNNNTYRNDALRYETAKLFHSLTPEELKRFTIVRQYVSLNQCIAKRSQHSKLHAAINHPVDLNKKVLNELSIKRNQLASSITKQLELYKPYLKHYSIGELNRVGLFQHEYRQGEQNAQKKLESLAKHAEINELRLKISHYLESSGPEKEFMATQLKRTSKLTHSLILSMGKPAETLWRDINYDAKQHSHRLFRNGLNPEGRLVFDLAKEYKDIKREIGELWAVNLEQEEKGIVDERTQKLFARRDELANQLSQHKCLFEVKDHFKIDVDTLTKQTEKHKYRENVQDFITSTGRFDARLQAINRIKEDIKGHYTFLKEAQVDTKLFSKYCRVVDRKEYFETLTKPEQADYKLFLNYKMTSKHAFRQWQVVHQENQKGQLTQAMQSSAKRDYLAYQLAQSPFLDSIVNKERGNKEKIVHQGSQHQSRLQEVATANKTLHQFANQSHDSQKEVAVWVNNWSKLCQELNRLEKHSMYQWAIKENPIQFNLVKQINKDLADLYDYKPDPFAKGQSPQLKQVQQLSQRLDGNVITEALMASPEYTYQSIFGKPKSQNSKEIRYSGGLIVTLKGSKQGLWYDFSEDVGGSPIDAIMKMHNLPFPEALKRAADLIGYRPIGLPTSAVKKPSLSKESERKNRITSAKSIWDGSVSMKGTLAERYLKEHRGIHGMESLDARFWPVGVKWINCNDEGVLENKTNKVPALIIAARNEKGDLTGVQRIYLDAKTANKNKFMEVAKLSKGITEGSAGLIQKGMKGSCLYVAEGPETAASIAMADRKATVLASFGVYNISNLTEVIKKYNAKEVVIAADNDGKDSKSLKGIEKAVENLAQNGIPARVIFPEALPGKLKTDWNDVLISKGVGAVQQQLFGVESKDVQLGLAQENVEIPKNLRVFSGKSIQSNEIKIQNNLHNVRNINERRERAVEMEIDR